MPVIPGFTTDPVHMLYGFLFACMKEIFVGEKRIKQLFYVAIQLFIPCLQETTHGLFNRGQCRRPIYFPYTR